MTAYSRLPPDQRSPYESIGRGGKIQKPPETRSEHVQGCGDPACQICMPAGRPQDAGGAKPGWSGGNAFSALQRQIMAEMVRSAGARPDLNAPLFSIGIDGQTFTTSNVRVGENEAARGRAAAEERRLRPGVERFFLKTEHDLAWNDVVGNDAARAALMEAIEHPVRHKDVYAHYGMAPTKGVLLYGPPGCGKTMFGKAAASILAKLHGAGPSRPTLLHINGPEIQSPYVGVTEDLIRNIFAYARAYKALHGAPLVVFIDEADSILPSRSGGNGTRRALPWEESQVATFLTEMDGLEDSGAFVILATNRPTAIDEAVLRDGRCDRKIKVERPAREAAIAIVRNALKGVPLGLKGDVSGVDVDAAASAAIEDLFDPFRRLARLDHGAGPDFLTMADVVNGAMLVGLVAQAKANAFRRDIAAGARGPTLGGLTTADFEAAVDALTEQNRVLRHSDALDEVAGRIEGQVSVTPIAVPFRRAA